MRYRTRTVTGIVGAVASVLLHSLFVAAMVLGDGGDEYRFPDRPEAIGAGANRGTPDGESTERRIDVRFITPVDAETSPSAENAQLSELLNSVLKLQVTGPDTLPLPPLNFDTDGEPAESTDADVMARTKMAGIYERQMRARIERAWTLPAEFLPEQSFTCRALIRQSPGGSTPSSQVPPAVPGCSIWAISTTWSATSPCARRTARWACPRASTTTIFIAWTTPRSTA